MLSTNPLRWSGVEKKTVNDKSQIGEKLYLNVAQLVETAHIYTIYIYIYTHTRTVITRNVPENENQDRIE